MAGINAEVKTSNSISRYGVPGWYSRLIYIYNGEDNDAIDNTDIFEDIEGKYSTYKKGSHQWPNEFTDSFTLTNSCIQWEFEGSFLVSGSTDNQLNVITGIQNGDTNQLRWYQNNGSAHTLAGSVNNCPVHFKFNLIHAADNYFQGSGYYQYDYSDYNSGGRNNSTAYVPIYITEPYRYLLVTKPMKFIFTVSGQPIKLQYLTIKEFGT